MRCLLCPPPKRAPHEPPKRARATSRQARAPHILPQVFGAFAAFFAAFGIGANDVANAFATSVGSKALTVKQACAIAVVMEFIGATFLGGEVVKTIRKGIADEEAFEDNAPLLMYGCLCTIFSVGIWLVTACRLEMPVSTTHSCVGGMIGMAIAARGSDAVVCFKDPDPPDKPLPGGFFGVVLSWFLSPICSGVLASLFFLFVRTVLRSKNAFQNSVRVYPLLVFACVTIITLFMLMKGIKSNKDIKAMEVETKVGSPSPSARASPCVPSRCTFCARRTSRRASSSRRRSPSRWLRPRPRRRRPRSRRARRRPRTKRRTLPWRSRRARRACSAAS
jgi:phosphate/sulfate permease